MAEFYDISLDFSIDSTGDIKMVEDNDAIVQSLRNIIETSTGFKPGTGDVVEIFGVGLNDYLFAPLTSFTGRSIGDALKRNIDIFEPRVSVENISINVNTLAKRFEIEISYSVVKSGRTFTFKTVINQI